MDIDANLSRDGVPLVLDQHPDSYEETLLKNLKLEETSLQETWIIQVEWNKKDTNCLLDLWRRRIFWTQDHLKEHALQSF